MKGEHIISEIIRKEVRGVLNERYRTGEFFYYGSLDELRLFIVFIN